MEVALGKEEKPKVSSVKARIKAKDVAKKAPAKGGKKTDTDKIRVAYKIIIF